MYILMILLIILLCGVIVTCICRFRKNRRRKSSVFLALTGKYYNFLKHMIISFASKNIIIFNLFTVLFVTVQYNMQQCKFAYINEYFIF